MTTMEIGELNADSAGCITITSSSGVRVIGLGTVTSITIRFADGKSTVIVDDMPKPRDVFADIDRLTSMLMPIAIPLERERWGFNFEPAPRYLGPGNNPASATRPRRAQARACRMDRRRWKRRRFIQSLRSAA